eukprot:CAMPEP_0119487476 /NCGR_PEP_ID=MMETSP1344-20130328/13553_1 /TAXON_ID=236787 /ORGANISM="Florenciella parvula, Strain CCMP2471" /LENGTH=208 /DNA_ID=CAMNT_0007522341 /DNA_START=38 /DNA_END=662 /DNA_ORIENTATION=-
MTNSGRCHLAPRDLPASSTSPSPAWHEDLPPFFFNINIKLAQEPGSEVLEVRVLSRLRELFSLSAAASTRMTASLSLGSPTIDLSHGEVRIFASCSLVSCHPNSSETVSMSLGSSPARNFGFLGGCLRGGGGAAEPPRLPPAPPLGKGIQCSLCSLQQATEQYLSLQPGHRYFAPPTSPHTVQSFADAALFTGRGGSTGAGSGAASSA